MEKLKEEEGEYDYQNFIYKIYFLIVKTWKMRGKTNWKDGIIMPN